MKTFYIKYFDFNILFSLDQFIATYLLLLCILAVVEQGNFYKKKIFKKIIFNCYIINLTFIWSIVNRTFRDTCLITQLKLFLQGRTTQDIEEELN